MIPKTPNSSADKRRANTNPTRKVTPELAKLSITPHLKPLTVFDLLEELMRNGIYPKISLRSI